MVGLSIKDPIRERELFNTRALILLVLIILMLGVLVMRFVQLQIWEHETFQTRSDQNRIQVQPIAPPRGLIFERRDGSVLTYAEAIRNHFVEL